MGVSVDERTHRRGTRGLLRRALNAALAAIALCSSPVSAQQKVERRLPLGMDAAFRVVNMVGSVVVHGWEKDTLLVRGTLDAGDRLFVGGSYTGAKLFVEQANDRDPKPTRLEIWVPSRVRLWIKTATASIDVSEVAGGLDLYVVSGTIDVTGNPHELNAEAIDGDIHITGTPSWIRAKSAAGAITFQGSSPDVGLSTVSGTIRVVGGTSAFERAKIETVTGNISFAGRLDRSGAFDFDTHSGSVEIAIPEKTSASFTIVAIAGSITNNLSGTRPTAVRFSGRAEARTDEDGDGAKVSVRTFKGPVTLRRSK